MLPRCLALLLFLAAPAAMAQTAQPKPAPAAPGTTFRDCTTCPEMRVVPPGQFIMGEEGSGRTTPRHAVVIARPFAIGLNLVTFEEWDACVAEGGCGLLRLPDQGWGRGRRPVINVNWEQAAAFAAWLARKTGRPYRLPSEAEWEYACRAGTTTPFGIGGGQCLNSQLANFDGNYPYGSGREAFKWLYRQRPLPQGSFPPNGWGLHDLHGQLWEWCEDEYSDRDRVLRGGSWRSGGGLARSAFRYGRDPVNRLYHFGFRPCPSSASSSPMPEASSGLRSRTGREARDERNDRSAQR